MFKPCFVYGHINIYALKITNPLCVSKWRALCLLVFTVTDPTATGTSLLRPRRVAQMYATATTRQAAEHSPSPPSSWPRAMPATPTMTPSRSRRLPRRAASTYRLRRTVKAVRPHRTQSAATRSTFTLLLPRPAPTHPEPRQSRPQAPPHPTLFPLTPLCHLIRCK